MCSELSILGHPMVIQPYLFFIVGVMLNIASNYIFNIILQMLSAYPTFQRIFRLKSEMKEKTHVQLSIEVNRFKLCIDIVLLLYHFGRSLYTALHIDTSSFRRFVLCYVLLFNSGVVTTISTYYFVNIFTSFYIQFKRFLDVCLYKEINDGFNREEYVKTLTTTMKNQAIKIRIFTRFVDIVSFPFIPFITVASFGFIPSMSLIFASSLVVCVLFIKGVNFWYLHYITKSDWYKVDPSISDSTQQVDPSILQVDIGIPVNILEVDIDIQEGTQQIDSSIPEGTQQVDTSIPDGIPDSTQQVDTSIPDGIPESTQQIDSSIPESIQQVDSSSPESTQQVDTSIRESTQQVDTSIQENKHKKEEWNRFLYDVCIFFIGRIVTCVLVSMCFQTAANYFALYFVERLSWNDTIITEFNLRKVDCYLSTIRDKVVSFVTQLV